MKSILLLPVIPVFLALGMGCGKAPAPVAAPVPEVDVVPATMGLMTESSEAIGTVKALEAVDLIARVEGYLVKRHFEEGAAVKKGQLLYEIEPEIYAAKVKSAEAQLEQERATQSNAVVDYERQQKLVRQDAVSERAYDSAKTVKLAADAKVKAAEAELALAKKNLEYTKIYSPFDGFIGINAVSEGNLVNQSTGTLATVVKSSDVRVEFVIPESTLVKMLNSTETVRPELDIRLFSGTGVPYAHPGTISFWDNQVKSTTGTFRIQARFSNRERKLLPGMYVRVRIALKNPRRALLISRLAILSDQAGDYVYIVGKDGKVARRDLKLGFSDLHNVVVESGLEAGDPAIVSGIQKVRPGASATMKVDEKLLAELTGKPESKPAVKPESKPAVKPESKPAVKENK